MAEVLIEVDKRRRLSLGKLAHHERYLAREQPDGTIVLTPAVVLSQHEYRLLQRPDLVARFEANRQDASRLVKRPRRRG